MKAGPAAKELGQPVQDALILIPHESAGRRSEPGVVKGGVYRASPTLPSGFPSSNPSQHVSGISDIGRLAVAVAAQQDEVRRSVVAAERSWNKVATIQSRPVPDRPEAGRDVRLRRRPPTREAGWLTRVQEGRVVGQTIRPIFDSSQY